MCQSCFLVCPDSRGVAALFFGVSRVFSGVYSVAVCPPCFLVCPECRGVSALISGVSRVFPGVYRVSRYVCLILLCVQSIFGCVQSTFC